MMLRIVAVSKKVSRCISTSSYLGSERDHLLQYKGGSVACEKDEQSGIAVITLDHPERKNALSGSMMVDLRDIVQDLKLWNKGKGLILSGANNTFCSGGDLALMKAIMTPEKGMRMSKYMQDTLLDLYHLPLLSVALIEGNALGGGAELTVACDLRAAVPSAKIGFVQCRMGVSPGWGGGAKLVNLIGHSQALQLLCSGNVLSAVEAKNIGLVEFIIKKENDYLGETKDLLSDLLPADCHVSQVAKQVVLAASKNNTLEDAMDAERQLFGTVWGGESQKKAIEKNIKHK